MKKFLKTIVFLMATTLTSCVFDDNTGSSVENNGELLINISIQDQSSGLATRSAIAPEEGEKNVNTLDIFFFEANSDHNGAWKASKHMDATAETPLSIGTDMPINFHEMGLSMSTAYDILVVANMGDNYLPTDGSSTLDEWKKDIESYQFNAAKAQVQAFLKGTSADSPEDYTTKPLGSDALLMSASLRKEAADTKIKIVIQRSVSRFDVYNSAEGYTLSSVAIWNAYSSAYVWDGESNSFEKEAERITRLYGVKSEAGASMEGKLYSFENYVPDPVQNDTLTTCLIVGIANNSTGTVSYHRVNVNPLESGQSLKRNNVYKVTINSIKKEGYTTELEAYKGKIATVSYSINYWDMDSQGIVQFDEDGNILAVPTKKVLFNPNGRSYDLSIFTFGKGTLSISKKVLDDGLSAALSGKTLTVAATPLANVKDKRSGLVELSFGNLKATIDIEQLEGGDLYLELKPASIKNFSYTAGTAAPEITVKASGDWNASIYPPGIEAFFSFDQPESAALTDYDSDKSPDNTIPVFTYSANEDVITRYGFLVVSLKEDPSIKRMMLLIQNGIPGFELTPDVYDMAFDPDGEFILEGNNANAFKVSSGISDDGTTVNAWHAVLEGDDAGLFDMKYNYDPNSTAFNKVTVKAKGANMTGKELKAQLYLVMDSDPTVKSRVINITQEAYTFETSIATTSVSENEDETEIISLIGSSNLKWTATLEQPTPELEHTYNIQMVNEKGNEMSWGTAYGLSTKFKIKFPKILYKDANKAITYQVKIQLVGTTETIVAKTITITRDELIPITINVASLNALYGSFNNGYYGNFFDYGRYASFFGTGKIVDVPNLIPTATPTAVGATISDETNIIFPGQYYDVTPYTTQYDAMMSWLQDDKYKNRIAILALDLAGTAQALFNREFASLGYKYVSISTQGKLIPDAEHSNDLVWNYIVNDGPFSKYSSSKSIDYTTTFYTDGGVVFSVPDGVTKVMETATNGCVLSIDLKNRIIFIGDSQYIGYGTDVPLPANLNATGTSNVQYTRGVLCASLWAIIYNTAMYGDHFTDTLTK